MKDLVTIVYNGIETIVNKYIGDQKSDGQIPVSRILDELDGLNINLDNALIVFNARHDKKYYKYDMVNSLYLEWYCESYDYEEWLNDNNKPLEERVKQANENIESLIDEIISLRKESEDGICAFPDRQDKEGCNDCSDCTREYLDKKKKSMLLQYKI